MEEVASLEISRLIDYVWGTVDPKVLRLATKRVLREGNVGQLIGLLNDLLVTHHGDRQEPSTKKLSDLSALNARRRCNYMFKLGDIAWNCRTCQADDSCVLCMECFKGSNHTGHEVFFHKTRPGGCCDCGDEEAWDARGFCMKHSRIESKDDPLSNFPSPLLDRSRVILTEVVKLLVESAVTVLNSYVISVVATFQPGDHYSVVLHNDDVHTYDDVRHALQELGCGDTIRLTERVDQQGQAIIHENVSLPTALRSQRRLQERGLLASVGYASLFEMEERSIQVVSWLQRLCLYSDGLRYLVGEAFTLRMQTPESFLRDDARNVDRTSSMLSILIRADAHLKKPLVTGLHELYMLLIIDAKFKRHFGIDFTEWYSYSSDQYLRGLGTQAETIFSCSVQLFTSPSLVRMLESKSLVRVLLENFRNALYRTRVREIEQDPRTGETGGSAVSSIQAQGEARPRASNTATAGGASAEGTGEASPAVAVSTVSRARTLQKVHLNPANPIFEHRRYTHIIRDLEYVLHIPGQAAKFAASDESVKIFLHCLALLQGLDSYQRRRHTHVEMETRTWIYAFNVSVSTGGLFAVVLKGLRSHPEERYSLDPADAELVQLLGKSASSRRGSTSSQHSIEEGRERSESRGGDAPPSLELESVGHVSAARSLQHHVLRKLDEWLVLNQDMSPVTIHPPYPLEAVSLVQFDVATENVSLHYPLHRFFARFLLELAALSYDAEGFPQAFSGPETTDTSFIRSLLRDYPRDSESGLRVRLGLIEYPLRSFVWIAQITVGMWQRNGLTMLNQMLNYTGPPLCRELRDYDLTLLQFGALELGPSHFVSAVLHRFGLLEWFLTENGETESMLSEYSCSLAEECLLALIWVITELPPPPLPSIETTCMESLRREVIHRLVAQPCSYNELSECTSLLLNLALLKTSASGHTAALKQVLDEVATRRTVSSASSIDPGRYELKPAYYEQYNHCFHHLTRAQHEAALERCMDQRRRNKKASGLASPSASPSLTSVGGGGGGSSDSDSTQPVPVVGPPPKAHPAFEDVRKIALVPAIFKLLRILLFHAQNPSSPKQSEMLLSRAVHILTLQIHIAESVDAKNGQPGYTWTLSDTFGEGTEAPTSPRDGKAEASSRAKGEEIRGGSVSPDNGQGSEMSVDGSNSSTSRSDSVGGVAFPSSISARDFLYNQIRCTQILRLSVPVAGSDGKREGVRTEVHEVSILTLLRGLSQRKPKPSRFSADGIHWLLDKYVKEDADCARILGKMTIGTDGEAEKAVKEAQRKRAQQQAMLAMQQRQAAFAKTMAEMEWESEDELAEESLSPRGGGGIGKRAPPSCIMCHEKTGAVIGYIGFVQKSAVSICHGFPHGEGDSPWIYPPSRSQADLHLQYCGHALHFECWDAYHVTMMNRLWSDAPYEGRSALQINKMEFLCPLCKSLSNVLVPHLSQLEFQQMPAAMEPAGSHPHQTVRQWLRQTVAQTLQTPYSKLISPSYVPARARSGSIAGSSPSLTAVSPGPSGRGHMLSFTLSPPPPGTSVDAGQATTSSGEGPVSSATSGGTGGEAMKTLNALMLRLQRLTEQFVDVGRPETDRTSRAPTMKWNPEMFHVSISALCTTIKSAEVVSQSRVFSEHAFHGNHMPISGTHTSTLDTEPWHGNEAQGLGRLLSCSRLLPLFLGSDAEIQKLLQNLFAAHVGAHTSSTPLRWKEILSQKSLLSFAQPFLRGDPLYALILLVILLPPTRHNILMSARLIALSSAASILLSTLSDEFAVFGQNHNGPISPSKAAAARSSASGGSKPSSTAKTARNEDELDESALEHLRELLARAAGTTVPNSAPTKEVLKAIFTAAWKSVLRQILLFLRVVTHSGVISPEGEHALVDSSLTGSCVDYCRRLHIPLPRDILASPDDLELLQDWAIQLASYSGTATVESSGESSTRPSLIPRASGLLPPRVTADPCTLVPQIVRRAFIDNVQEAEGRKLVAIPQNIALRVWRAPRHGLGVRVPTLHRTLSPKRSISRRDEEEAAFASSSEDRMDVDTDGSEEGSNKSRSGGDSVAKEKTLILGPLGLKVVPSHLVPHLKGWTVIKEFPDRQLSLLTSKVIRFHPLPPSYTELYEEIAKQPCIDCNQTDRAVCLLCGALLCAGKKVNGVGECTRHSYHCGSGTGVFFLVQKCAILLICGSKASYFSSPYVDEFGEEDMGVQRGRPLFLNPDRLRPIWKMWAEHQIAKDIARSRVSLERVIRDNFY